MEAGGFAVRVHDADFIRRTRAIPFVHVRTAMPLDVVLAGSGLENEFLDRGRPKDLDDARNLWRTRGELNAERVRRTLSLLEQALSQSDLVPAFEVFAGRRPGNTGKQDPET